MPIESKDNAIVAAAIAFLFAAQKVALRQIRDARIDDDGRATIDVTRASQFA